VNFVSSFFLDPHPLPQAKLNYAVLMNLAALEW